MKSDKIMSILKSRYKINHQIENELVIIIRKYENSISIPTSNYPIISIENDLIKLKYREIEFDSEFEKDALNIGITGAVTRLCIKEVIEDPFSTIDFTSAIKKIYSYTGQQEDMNETETDEEDDSPSKAKVKLKPKPTI